MSHIPPPSPLSYNSKEWCELFLPLSAHNPRKARYRATQVCDWIYKKLITDYTKMSNLPKNLRDSLQEKIPIELPEVKKVSLSVDGTKKYLLELTDGNLIEMVLIPAQSKQTLCVSSQVGCLRKCRFCATGNSGFNRSLNAAEIIAQVLIALQDNRETKLTNIVFMGMGEPLDNLDNLCKSIRLLQEEQTLSFSPRRITVSTCGIIPGMRKLFAERIKVKLAVSLNSAIQEKREYLMPVAKLYPLPTLKEELLFYQRNNPFRVTFEYIMIKDFNIGKEDAQALIDYIGDLCCKVNLISWNKTTAKQIFQSPSAQEIERFTEYLQVLPFAVTYRKSRGDDINAACGQLAARAKMS
jgi:23S rRNA (adenine2503-C2)-methyltransferase